MIPVLYRYIGGFAVFFLLLGGAYLKGKSNGKEIVQAELDAQRAVWQEQYDAKVAEAARIQAEWDKAKEIERDLQERLGAVSSDAADVARRLRLAARSCKPLPTAPSNTGDTGEASRESSDLGELEERHFSACARDAERLNALQNWYNTLRDAQ